MFCCLLYDEEQVANDSSGKPHHAVADSDVQINCSDGGGLTELEKLLKQKTFTRYFLFIYAHIYNFIELIICYSMFSMAINCF